MNILADRELLESCLSGTSAGFGAEEPTLEGLQRS